ncbi:MAG: imm11 family protein [Hyalangium sp.]|uniref:imm11 family protein n=1 Tax=Hyalangium sp. TaxID=2028555 RepID=UPI003899E466
MPRYYELMDDRRSLTRWHLGTPLDAAGQELDPWQFFEGHALDLGCVPRFPLDVPGEPLDFCWAAFAIPVVHERFVQIFQRLRVQDVQFIPTRVEGHSDPFFILNTLRTIRCIDDARCEEVKYWRPEDGQPEKVGTYRYVHALRIDPSKVGDARVFRTWGWDIALIVSDDLKQAIEAGGITGTRFVEV